MTTLKIAVITTNEHFTATHHLVLLRNNIYQHIILIIKQINTIASDNHSQSSRLYVNVCAQGQAFLPGQKSRPPHFP